MKYFELQNEEVISLYPEAELLGEVLRQKRIKKSITQAKLATLLGINKNIISKLENGKNVGSHYLLKVMECLELFFELRNMNYQHKSFRVPQKYMKPDLCDENDSDKFEFPYDYSNPGNLRDEVLIMKVLKRMIFSDVVRLCKRFGVERIDEEIKSVFYDDIRDDLMEMMEIIHEAYALKAAKAREN